MKKLPKAQLGAIVKGISKVVKPATKAVKPASKIAKSQARPVYKYESPIETINRQIKEGVITKGSGYDLPSGRKLNKNQKDLSIPAYIATYGVAVLAAAAASGAFNKKPNINSRGTETVIHTGANGKKYVKVTTANDGKTYNKIIEPKKRKGGLIKNLPKAQLGGIIKGVSKFFGPAIGATGKSSKIIKPVAKTVKSAKSKSRIPGVADNAKFMAKNIGAGALLAIPPYLGIVGGAKYDKMQANKKKFTNTKGTETKVHKGKDGKKYVKVTTRDGKTYNKTIK